MTDRTVHSTPVPCDYAWFNGRTTSYRACQVPISAHSLHYGAAVFEGVRFYEQSQGGTAIFRLSDHLARLRFSAETMQMEIPYSAEELTEAAKELIQLNRLTAGYIRYLVFLGEGIGLMQPGLPVQVAIMLLPWARKEKPIPIRLKTSSWSRLSPRSVVAEAKVAGHYVNLLLAAREAQADGYDDAIMFDHQGLVAETSVANIFMVMDGWVLTPQTGSILPGITRHTVLELGTKLLKLHVEERDLTREALDQADEIFITGTAAEVTPVIGIDHREIPLQPDSVTAKLQGAYESWVQGALLPQSCHHWLTTVYS